MNKRAEFGDPGQFPMYTDDEGSTLFDLRDMLQLYYAGMGDPLYAIQSRDMVDPSEDEFLAIQSLLSDIIDGKYDDVIEEESIEEDRQGDYMLAESWLPTINRLVSENEPKEDMDDMGMLQPVEGSKLELALDLCAQALIPYDPEPAEDTGEVGGGPFFPNKLIEFAHELAAGDDLIVEYETGDTSLYIYFENKNDGIRGMLDIQFEEGDVEYVVSASVIYAESGSDPADLWDFSQKSITQDALIDLMTEVAFMTYEPSTAFAG